MARWLLFQIRRLWLVIGPFALGDMWAVMLEKVCASREFRGCDGRRRRFGKLYRSKFEKWWGYTAVVGQSSFKKYLGGFICRPYLTPFLRPWLADSGVPLHTLPPAQALWRGTVFPHIHHLKRQLLLRRVGPKQPLSLAQLPWRSFQHFARALYPLLRLCLHSFWQMWEELGAGRKFEGAIKGLEKLVAMRDIKVGKERLWIWFLILKSILKNPRGSGQIYLSGSTCPWPSDNTYHLPQIVRSVTGMELWEQEHLSMYVTREDYLSYHLLTTIDIRLTLSFEKTQISLPKGVELSNLPPLEVAISSPCSSRRMSDHVR